MSRIVEGSTVLARDDDGKRKEAIADGPPNDGELCVRFTTRGEWKARHVSKVEWVADPW